MEHKILAVLLLLFLASCAQAVQRGDTVLVTYTGRYQNGTVFDTNDPKLLGNFSAPASHFTPLSVKIGADQVVPGFEQAIMGMRKGETKEVLIKAKDAYGGYDPSKVIEVPRRFSVQPTFPVQRRVDVAKTDFKQAADVGNVFETKNFRYNITGMNDTHVFLYIINATHDPIVIDPASWNSTLVSATKDALLYKHLITDNATYRTENGPYTAHWNGTAYVFDTVFELGGAYQTGNAVARATKETPSSIFLDFNPELAGQDLNFTITVDAIDRQK